MMKIETERLYIRHFVNEDASICFEGWGTDEHLGDFLWFSLQNTVKND